MKSGENKAGEHGTTYDTGLLKEMGTGIVTSAVLKDWLTPRLDEFEGDGGESAPELAIQIKDQAFEALRALGTQEWEAIAVDMIADRPDRLGDGQDAGVGNRDREQSAA